MTDVIVVNHGNLEDIVLIGELISKGFTVNVLSFKLTDPCEKRLAIINEINTYYELNANQILLKDQSFLFEDSLTKQLIVGSYAAAYSKQLNNAEVYIASYNSLYDAAFPPSLSKSIYVSSAATIKINLPYLRKSLVDIVKIGIAINTPFEKTWSCTTSIETPCMFCDKCLERYNAFVENIFPDPINPISSHLTSYEPAINNAGSITQGTTNTDNARSIKKKARSTTIDVKSAFEKTTSEIKDNANLTTSPPVVNNPVPNIDINEPLPVPIVEDTVDETEE